MNKFVLLIGLAIPIAWDFDLAVDFHYRKDTMVALVRSNYTTITHGWLLIMSIMIALATVFARLFPLSTRLFFLGLSAGLIYTSMMHLWNLNFDASVESGMMTVAIMLLLFSTAMFWLQSRMVENHQQ